MQRICVYCGSSPGRNAAYQQAAQSLAGELARRGLDLVYGGASVGLMGVLADASLAAGCRVIGVIPEVLKRKEVMHTDLSELRTVGSMHQRKALMNELSDGFIALPGGFGTLDELFEILTWGQLGLHAKPIGLLNVASYFDPLIECLDSCVENGFVSAAQRQALLVADQPAKLLDAFTDYRAPDVEHWLNEKNI